MTPEEVQQVAQMRAMALRGQAPQAMTQDADVLSGLGGALAGWGGKSGAAVSENATKRADALRQIGTQQGMTTQREAGDAARSIADLASRRDIANSNNAAEMERLKLSLAGKEAEDKAKKAGQVSESETKYRQQLFQLQPVKDAMQMGAAYQGINQALGQKSAAGDMAGIFQFMKILDPASSVREGEYASAKNATGVPEQIINMYNKAKDGQLLSSAQRKDFLGTARGKYATQLKEAKKYADAFGGLATQDGGDPARVTTGLDFSLMDEPQAQAAPSQPKTEAEYAQLPAGAVYLDKDGKPRRKK